MHALILAAGRGLRLAQATPKCLIEVGGRPLLSHQLEAVRNAGATQATVVVGHCHEQVRAIVGDDTSVVLNDRYAATNSLYSFWLARQAVKGELLVLNCDVLFPHQALTGLLECEGSALAFDSSSGGRAEHMKVSVQDGQLVEMSKQLPPALTSGENLGLLRLTEKAAETAFDAAARLLRQGGERDWVGAAINLVARRHPIACVDVAGLPWVEIDFPHDLAAARERIWPAIEALGHGLGIPPARARPERRSVVPPIVPAESTAS
jgi:choline kinase